jgi:hypothetical protein
MRRADDGVEDESSAEMSDSTSSIAIKTFSGLRSITVEHVDWASALSLNFTCMDHTATAMHVIQAEKNLLGDLFDDVGRYALVLMPLDKTQQILPKNFEHHADMSAIRAFMTEVVKE